MTLSLQSFTELLPVNDQELDSESNRVLTLTHRKLPDGPDLQFWNASMWLHLSPDRRNNNINLTIEHKNAKDEIQTVSYPKDFI